MSRLKTNLDCVKHALRCRHNNDYRPQTLRKRYVTAGILSHIVPFWVIHVATAQDKRNGQPRPKGLIMRMNEQRIREMAGLDEAEAQVNKAIKIAVGEFGGNESDYHIHENGGGAVANTAEVSATAYVAETAIVAGKARVSGNARVYGKAQVFGNAEVSGKAGVSGNAEVSGKAWVSGDAKVSGTTHVSGNTEVVGEAAQDVVNGHKGQTTGVIMKSDERRIREMSGLNRAYESTESRRTRRNNRIVEAADKTQWRKVSELYKLLDADKSLSRKDMGDFVSKTVVIKGDYAPGLGHVLYIWDVEEDGPITKMDWAKNGTWMVSDGDEWGDIDGTPKGWCFAADFKG